MCVMVTSVKSRVVVKLKFVVCCGIIMLSACVMEIDMAIILVQHWILGI